MKLQKFMADLLIIFFVVVGIAISAPRGLDFDEKEIFGKDWILREDIQVFADPVIESLQANIYQKNAQLRLTFSLTPDSEEKSVNCTLHFNPMYFFVRGKPILVDTRSKSKQEIDYKFANEHLSFKVTVRDYLKYIEFGVASRKLKNLGKLTIEDKLKQARTIRRIRQKLESWSPLAPAQIIAQETLRPIVSHGGYAVNGIKRAIIWANNTKLSGKFEIIDALNNVQHPDPQAVVYSGDLQEAGTHIWGGNNYIADFSDFKKEGLYFIRLKVNETNELSDSYVFPIKKDIYLDLATKAAKWFYYQRCGTEVPGFHKACHTQDTIIKTDGSKVDVSGGWHDAGDYGKWIGAGTSGVLALTLLQDEFGEEFQSSAEIPEFIDEAAWEARYFCKSYWDGIFHMGFTGNFENVCQWLGAPECEPPRIVMEQQMLENKYGYLASPRLSLTGSSLAKVSRQILPFDNELAKKCISIATEVYELDRKFDLQKPEYKNSYLWVQTGLLMCAMELYQITKKENYHRDAIAYVENILELQDKEGFFYLDRAKTSDKFTEGQFHLVALYEFLKHNPNNKLANRIITAFRRWADYNMQFVSVSNFGVIGGREENGNLRNLYKNNYRNRRVGAFAWGLATAALLCKNKAYFNLAEQQIQWVIGLNPADVSMMAGIGRGPGCYHHRYCFMEGCEHGIVPGGILNGLFSGKGKIIEIGDITKNYIIAEVPTDYPVIDTDVWGWTYGYVTNEYWTRNNSWFVLGAFQLEKASQILQIDE